MLDHGENVALVALAETVINEVLNHVKKTKQSTLEEMLAKNFLVDTDIVTNRKSKKLVRTRDHKLQILFRVELQLNLTCPSLIEKNRKEMLDHLTKITIWDSQNEMLTFLQEIVTPFYIGQCLRTNMVLKL